jgi:hypothetical protein
MASFNQIHRFPCFIEKTESNASLSFLNQTSPDTPCQFQRIPSSRSEVLFKFNHLRFTLVGSNQG